MQHSEREPGAHQDVDGGSRSDAATGGSDTAGERRWSPVSMPAQIRPPAGAYSPAVRAGSLIFVSGQVPKDQRTGETLGGDVREQTRIVLGNAARVLEAAGASLADVVSVTAYLERIEDWDAFDEAYREAFEPPYPTRTTVGAALHGFLVEISLVAVARI
jgi:2-iminobutanoate/2-iminopropanoate deaminase